MTRSGVIAGTPQYMSPEQARGEAIDARSDLFSLGSLLYAMCAGHSPFRAETSYGVLHRITHDSPRAIRELNPNIPEWLEQIVMKLLSKSREDRFGSAEEVSELLEDCLAYLQHPTTTPLPKSVEQLSQLLPSTQSSGSGRKHLRQLFFIGFAAFALILAGVLIVLETNKGTLTIQCELDDVPIRIMQGDKTVERLMVTKSGDSVRVAAGTYVVELETKLDGILVENSHISLKRGAMEYVKIRLSKKEIQSHSDEEVSRKLQDSKVADLPNASASKWQDVGSQLHDLDERFEKTEQEIERIWATVPLRVSLSVPSILSPTREQEIKP